MIRQLVGTSFAARCYPMVAMALLCVLSFSACATTAAAPVAKKPSPCESVKPTPKANPLQNDVRPIGTCKEPVRDEVKGKANDQDDQILY